MMAENKNQGQSSKPNKTYEDAAGNRVSLDEATARDRVASGELREVTEQR
jgi:hypothetical protein